MATYKIVRHFFNGGSAGGGGKRRTIETGLTLQQAQERTTSPESSWKTATSKTAKARTRKNGPWFDGYYEE